MTTLQKISKLETKVKILEDKVVVLEHNYELIKNIMLDFNIRAKSRNVKTTIEQSKLIT